MLQVPGWNSSQAIWCIYIECEKSSIPAIVDQLFRIQYIVYGNLNTANYLLKNNKSEKVRFVTSKGGVHHEKSAVHEIILFFNGYMFYDE